MEQDGPVQDDVWRARRLRPVIIFYVIGVFVAFMALAGFVFHSTEAVKALFFAAIGGTVPLLPAVLSKVEYRWTDRGLEKRPFRPGDPEDFESVFLWDELSHVVPTRCGFKFYKSLPPSGPFRRFWNLHIDDGYSGEVHVDSGDQERALDVIARHRIPATRLGSPASLPGSLHALLGPGGDSRPDPLPRVEMRVPDKTTRRKR